MCDTPRCGWGPNGAAAIADADAGLADRSLLRACSHGLRAGEAQPETPRSLD